MNGTIQASDVADAMRIAYTAEDAADDAARIDVASDLAVRMRARAIVAFDRYGVIADMYEAQTKKGH